MKPLCWRPLRLLPLVLLLVGLPCALSGASRVLPAGELPDDSRLQPLKDLNGYFPFTPPKFKAEWAVRAERVRRRILVAQGALVDADTDAVECRRSWKDRPP